MRRSSNGKEATNQQAKFFAFDEDTGCSRSGFESPVLLPKTHISARIAIGASRAAIAEAEPAITSYSGGTRVRVE
jgi:hypothetical protein